MATKNPNKASVKSVKDLNASFTQSFDTLYAGVGISTHRRELDSIASKIDSIIDTELNSTKAITSDEMSTFLVKTFNDFDKTYGTTINSFDDIFQSNDAGLSQFFQDRYQNQNLLYDDLNMICKHLAELEEAVLTTRDAIVTADDISKTVSRSIYFENAADNDPAVENYKNIVISLESQNDLPKKIKSQIITNTLKYGKYYVYTVPYSKLFEQHYKYKLKDPTIGEYSVKESLTESACRSINDIVTESDESEYYTKFKEEIKGINKEYNATPANLETSMREYCEGITVTNDVYSIPLIEGVDVTQIMDSVEFKKKVEDLDKERAKSTKTRTTINDGVIDLDKKVEGKFNNIHDCYIKLIDPRKVVPVKILDTTLGYYYIHETELKRDRAPFSTTIKLSSSVGDGSYSDDVEAAFMSRITDKIIAAFDPKYVEKNHKFKDLILNALIYTDIYKKNVNFQFIPAEYMVEFSIDEDENGEGRSILMRSLFYAKLYLALLVFKMITIMTRSNDTRVYYIKNSGIDANITNKIQDVARSMKAKQINFMDLLNYNSIISKVGSYKDVYMPVGRSGERGIEFDTIAGQQVDLNSDLMEFLRTNMINGTGVPSVIMNYINEADYSRSLQMANTKFANRVLNLQLDLNPGLTKLYQNITRFSSTTIPDEYIDRLRYSLNPPTALNAQTTADDINTKDQLVLAIVKSKIGENANDDLTNIARDVMYNRLIKEYMPGINWDHIDAIAKDAMLEAEKELAKNNSNQQ